MYCPPLMWICCQRLHHRFTQNALSVFLRGELTARTRYNRHIAWSSNVSGSQHEDCIAVTT